MKKIIITIILFLSMSIFAIGSINDVDIIIAEYSNKIQRVLQIDNQEALRLANELYDSVKEKYPEQLYRTLIVKVDVLLEMGEFAKVDSLLKDAFDMKKDIHRSTYYTIRAQYENKQGNYDKALELIKLAELNVKKPLFFYLVAARIYDNLHKTDKAISYIQSYLELQKNKKNYENIVNLAQAYDMLSDQYYNKALYEEALSASINAQKYYEQSGSDLAVASILLQIAEIYTKLNNFKDADMLLEECVKRYEELGKPREVAKVLHSLGISKKNQKQYLEAIDYFQRSIAIKKQYGMHISIINSIANLANIEKALGRYKNAEQYYLQVIDDYKKLGYKLRLAMVLANYSECLLNMGNYTKALSILKQSEEYNKAYNNAELNKFIQEMYHKIYYKLQNFKLAYEHLEKFSEIQKQISDEKNSRILHEMKSKYDKDFVLRENELLTKEKTFQEKQIIQLKKIRILFGLLIIVSLIALALIFIRYAQKKRENRIILEKNALISSQAEEILAKNKLLEKSENKFRSLFEETKDALFILKEDVIIEVNDAVLTLFNIENEKEMVGKSILNISKEFQTDEITAESFWNEQKSIIQEFEFSRFEWSFIRKDNSVINVDVTTTVIKIENDSVLYMMCRDITEKRKLQKERELIQQNLFNQSKLATLGEIATGIAHEINQPLTYISSVVQNVMLDYNVTSVKADDIIRMLMPLQIQIDRIDKIVNHLRNYGTADMQDFVVLEFSSIIKNTLLLFREGFKVKGITFVNNLPDNLPRLKAIPHQLEQVLINIFQNAIEALEGVKDAVIKINSEIEDNFLIINIIDNGKGINEKDLDKIFYSFFTTKPLGKGTGLGLAIVKNIIEKHNGFVSIESKINFGTKVKLSLPVYDKKL